MVIGALGRGEAPEGAYLFAQEVSAALIAGNQNAPSLQGVNSVSREAFISALNGINPRTYRLGSGREEPDGAVSFLIRFLGREQGITGELYLRPRNTGVEIAAGQNEEEEQLETAGQDDANVPAADSVVPGPADTEETPMEEPEETPVEAGRPEPEETPAEAGRPEPEVVARTVPVVWEFEDLILEEVQDRGVEVDHRYDFPPYERFF
jgi:hypothetical protein